ncbi:MAG: hypothetical protein K8S20_08420 [Chloroflexi bacterium]|nr:hypothetical protein [Chloroflexota bacterium]
MFNWQSILGVVLLLYAGFTVFRGRVTSGDDYGNTSVIDREKSPVYFWFLVAGQVVLGIILLLHLIPI